MYSPNLLFHWQECVCLQILPAVSAAMVLDTPLPAFQAGFGEEDSAAAAASWSFVRGFGNIWGVAIPGAILNVYIGQYAAETISDPMARSALQGSDAYSSATPDFIEMFSEPKRGQIIDAFTIPPRKVFLVGIAFLALSFILSFIEREVKLRTVLETKFRPEDREK
ncbi:hypothetical protein GGR52DRAFT_549289 [Hypoxylon sp. FL1284]|nr:hypothetical protein GGR52DRAFT_549289 [Hypoxylon sp. FL1284]